MPNDSPRADDAGVGRSRIPLPARTRLTRRPPRAAASALPAHRSPDALRAEVARRVASKGELRTSETLLVIVWALATAGLPSASAATLRAVYPAHGAPLGCMPDYLQSLVRNGLLERVAPAVYRATALGAAVADALPDRARVKTLRAMRLRPPGVRQTPWSAAVLDTP